MCLSPQRCASFETEAMSLEQRKMEVSLSPPELHSSLLRTLGLNLHSDNDAMSAN